MADNGWDIAMRRINGEFDIPQFVASTLVRRLAAHSFRLPATEREQFQQVPDHVIERIEQIVLAAYLEAGEIVGSDVLQKHLEQRARHARREMIASGTLLSLTDFRRRIGATEKRLERLLDDGSLFAVKVDEAQFIPAVLAEPAHSRRRLQAICRIIVPAPPMSRLDFLTSLCGSLGDRSPLDMLDDDDDFKLLRRVAEAWAAEWSRTFVTVYEGAHETEPSNVEPLYTAVAEIDPRRPLWERASEALHVRGYEWPLGPYPVTRNFSLFIARQMAGQSTSTREACVQILVDGEYIQIRIVAAPGTTLESETVSTGKPKSFIDIAKLVIAHLTNAKRT